MKFASKRELLERIEAEHAALLELAATIPTRRYAEPGVWGDDWSIKDLFAHLTEWEQMLLRWYRAGERGEVPAMPAEEFKWNETPRLNRAIQEKHAKRSWKSVRAAFDASYAEVLALARSLDEDDLLRPGRFAWTKKTPLMTYVAANSSSHYRTASGILKRWLRAQARKRDA